MFKKILEDDRKEKQLFFVYIVKILSLKFSVENDPMKGVESFTVLLLSKQKND